jgi:hypothetical protein
MPIARMLTGEKKAGKGSYAPQGNRKVLYLGAADIPIRKMLFMGNPNLPASLRLQASFP